MKIALVCLYDFAYTGGVQNHVGQLQRRLGARGHDVRVIAPSSRRPEELGLDNLIVVDSARPISGSGSVARINLDTGLRERVSQILREHSFDLIHLHEPLIPYWPLYLISGTTAPKVATFHAFKRRARGYALMKPLLTPYADLLSGRIAVSESTRRFISRYFPGEYAVIPNGVDTGHFARPAAPLEEYADGRPNILFVGRWDRRKGLDYLLHAYELVKQRIPEARLLVVGPRGSDYEKYTAYVKEHLLYDVVFVGPVEAAELPRYYQAADVFCSPATGTESFGYVLVEAMAAGAPVVASAIEGYSEVIEDGVSGRLVPPRDAQALAEVLVQLLRDPAERRRLAAAGRRRAAIYDWDVVSTQILDFYGNTLARPEAVRGAKRRLRWLEQIFGAI